jgi:hypothetical protein
VIRAWTAAVDARDVDRLIALTAPAHAARADATYRNLTPEQWRSLQGTAARIRAAMDATAPTFVERAREWGPAVSEWDYCGTPAPDPSAESPCSASAVAEDGRWYVDAITPRP